MEQRYGPASTLPRQLVAATFASDGQQGGLSRSQALEIALFNRLQELHRTGALGSTQLPVYQDSVQLYSTTTTTSYRYTGPCALRDHVRDAAIMPVPQPVQRS